MSKYTFANEIRINKKPYISKKMYERKLGLVFFVFVALLALVIIYS